MYQGLQSDTIAVGALSDRFLVEASDSNGTVTVFEYLVPAKATMPAPHSHDGLEETIYGLEGTSTWTIECEATAIGPGDAVCVPRGLVHGFANHAETDARSWRSPVRVSSAAPTSMRSPMSWRNARRTAPRSPR